MLSVAKAVPGRTSWISPCVGITSLHRRLDTKGMATSASPYTVQQLQGSTWGVEVHGIDLKQNVAEDVKESIKRDVSKHRLVVFRDQGIVPGERQMEISRWFGDLDSTTFAKHPRSPHPDIFRVSNDAQEGCTGVGRTGWHIDGTFQNMPYGYSLYHSHSIPRKGATVFLPLKEVVETLSTEQRGRWERLWMVSDRRDGPVHPLIYPHPITGETTMCFHTGMTRRFVWDWPNGRGTDAVETLELLNEMEETFRGPCRSLIYSHQWRNGDFIMSDNLALGHEASPETQLPRSLVGLRVMHRTTVAGRHIPTHVRLSHAKNGTDPSGLERAH
eukprot:jgi/Botrbrau1/12861/Bobra.0188s0004.1